MLETPPLSVLVSEQLCSIGRNLSRSWRYGHGWYRPETADCLGRPLSLKSGGQGVLLTMLDNFRQGNSPLEVSVLAICQEDEAKLDGF